MLYRSTIPAEQRLRLLEETDHSIALLEDRCRLLDEVIALRRERDALLSSRGIEPCVGDSKSVVNHTRYVPYQQPPYQAYHVTSTVVRPVPLIFARFERHSPTFDTTPSKPNAAISSNHLKLLRPTHSSLSKVVKSETSTTSPNARLPFQSRSAAFDKTQDNGTSPTDNTFLARLNQLPLHNRKLPSTFRLSPNTVVLGKGKGPKETSGNMRLKELVSDHLEEYKCSGRHGKMMVISKIICQIQSENMYHGVPVPGFVRFQDNCWWEVNEKECRIKLSATFRDLLSDKYRSSSKSKVAHRRQQRKHKQDVTDFVDAVKALQTFKA